MVTDVVLSDRHKNNNNNKRFAVSSDLSTQVRVSSTQVESVDTSFINFGLDDFLILRRPSTDSRGLVLLSSVDFGRNPFNTSHRRFATMCEPKKFHNYEPKVRVCD